MSVETGTALTKRWYKLKPHPQQSQAFRSNARFIIGLAGRRSGKTEVIGKRRTVRRILEFNKAVDGRFAFTAPTLDQARRIYWEDIKALIPGRLIRRVYESKFEILLVNGTTVMIAGMDKPQRLEGVPLDGVVLDEYADMKTEAWTNSVRPGLDTIGRPGWAAFIGKAKLGAVHYRQLCVEVQEGKRPGWEYYHWTAESVLDKDVLEQARRELDPLVYAYEYLADWAYAEGRTYYTFCRPLHLQATHYDKFAKLIFCFDFNISPGAAVVLQEQEWEGPKFLPHSDGRIVQMDDVVTAIIGEVHIPVNSNSQRVARKLCEDWAKHKGLIVCYGDATGGARGSAKVSGSDWDLIKNELRITFGDRVRYKIKSGNPLERVRVNALNARLLTADNRVHMIIDPVKAPCFIRDLEEVIWLKGGAAEIDKSDDNLTHWSDSVGYYCEYEYPLGIENLTSEPLY